MVDRDRVLATLDELEGHLGELQAVAPDRFEAYQRTETKRACERLIQVSVEAVIDICALLRDSLDTARFRGPWPPPSGA